MMSFRNQPQQANRKRRVASPCSRLISSSFPKFHSFENEGLSFTCIDDFVCVSDSSESYYVLFRNAIEIFVISVRGCGSTILASQEALY